MVFGTVTYRERDKKKRRRGIFRRIGNWWKRRSFYIVHDGSQEELLIHGNDVDITIEESFDIDEESRYKDSDMSTGDALMPTYTPMEMGPSYISAMQVVLPPTAGPFQRNRSKNSFQGSLESIDSLAESHWDPEDDTSQETPIVNNTAQPLDFFSEHVGFLRVQTQPRNVEVVWTTPEKE
jgi:hypothetical protein